MAGAVLPDGTYDAIVVDVATADDGSVALDLAIAAGEHRGEVVRVVDRGHEGEPLERLALPVTLTVKDGAPVISFES